VTPFDSLEANAASPEGDDDFPGRASIQFPLPAGAAGGPGSSRIPPMKNPPHPGRIVKQDCVEALGLTITETARALGVTRQALNNLVNRKAGISPEMAVRLSKAFGASPEMWLRLQANYDLAQVRQDEIEVKRYRRVS
jgi:antitoxin HigA-1